MVSISTYLYANCTHYYVRIYILCTYNAYDISSADLIIRCYAKASKERVRFIGELCRSQETLHPKQH